MRVFKKIRERFVIDDVFQTKKRNGQPFRLDFLKYVWRVLCKFPLENKQRDAALTEASLLSNIDSALRFIDTTIFPSLRKQRRRTCGMQSSEAREVSREELTTLWNTNQKRAIDVIHNNNTVAPRTVCPIDPDSLTQFYTEKSKKILQYPLPRQPWPADLDPPTPELGVNLEPFLKEEVRAVVKNLKTNTSPGYDGVEYGYLKKNLGRLLDTITTIFNICLKNCKIPADWKHATITLLPKKEANSTDPSDWRPISLLSSMYKIYMKLIQSRMLPWITSTNRLSARQKGSLPRNGLQEHVFNLKSAIDDFKHSSGRFFTTFVDIRDAYGSVDHLVMLQAMERAGYPQKVIDITRDIYTHSTFQVQTRGLLTRKITRARGIIQGCPWSAIAFVQSLDPWIRWLEQSLPPNSLPAPCQAYMDDGCMSSTQETDIHEMMQKTEQFLQYSGMEVKHAKCALIHAQRSGNNWAKKDNTAIHMKIQGGEIPKLGRTGHYRYLGHQVGLDNTSAKQQLQDIQAHFIDTVEKIDKSPLPVNQKIDAINIMAISQLNFYFPNMQFTEKTLKNLEDKIVECIRSNLKLNTSSTRAHIFTPRREGGLGVIKPSTMYHAKRISFLLSALNSDDMQVKTAARSSLTLHMAKRKVPVTTDTEEESFCGYKTKANGQLYKESKVNWSKSIYVELNELCTRLKTKMTYDSDTDLFNVSIPVSEENDIFSRYSDPKILFSELKKQDLANSLRHWHELKQQGRLLREAFPHADMASSNEHLKNIAIWDNLTRFVVKGRLQLLETNAVNQIYYPGSYPRDCSLCEFHIDTNSHALNNCRRLRGLYTERHDRCVELVLQALTKYALTEY